MSTTQELFQQSQLAEAAYANFSDPRVDPVTALQNKGFSHTQAAEFVAHWKVVDQYDNSALGGLVGTGFSATVFESLDNPGHYSLAIRGSQGVNDFLADAAVIVNQGVAIYQLMDLYNFWQRAQTPAGSSYQAAVLEPIGTGPLRDAIFISGLPYKVKPVDSSQLSNPKLQFGSMQPGQAVNPASLLDVSGHSLGGHLAMAFTRMFPNVNANAIAVNGLGFKLNNSTVNNLFAQLGGSTSFTASSIQNVYGLNGPEFAAMNNFLLQQPGGWDGVFIETATPNIGDLTGNWLGHSVSQMTDSLAVYELFAKVAPGLNTDPNGIGQITSILKASSNVAANSLESAVTALGELFQVPSAVVTGNAFDGAGRDKLYVALNALETELAKPANAGLSIKPFVTTLDNGTDIIMPGNSLASSASADTPDGTAYRYALVHGNAFAVVGADYSAHAAELALYDSATGTGTLTEQYLKDRAEMLWREGFLNTRDLGGITDAAIKTSTEYTEYTDSGQKVSFNVDNLTNSPRRKVLFGSKNADTTGLVGGAQDDSIYGMGGADTLQGNGGDDYLEGGTGNDTYSYNTGDGIDTILDTDGNGQIQLNGAALDVSTFKRYGSVWKNEQDTISITVRGAANDETVLCEVA